MSRRTQTAWVVAFIAGAISIAAFLTHIAHPRTIAAAVAPDGTEMRIVQEFNWDPELFTTSFVYRKPGAEWRWFYYDHEDMYWRLSRAALETNKHLAVFYRGDSPAVTFDWNSEIYTMHRWNRTLTNAQSRMPADWTPRMSVHSGG